MSVGRTIFVGEGVELVSNVELRLILEEVGIFFSEGEKGDKDGANNVPNVRFELLPERGDGDAGVDEIEESSDATFRPANAALANVSEDLEGLFEEDGREGGVEVVDELGGIVSAFGRASEEARGETNPEVHDPLFSLEPGKLLELRDVLNVVHGHRAVEDTNHQLHPSLEVGMIL